MASATISPVRFMLRLPMRAGLAEAVKMESGRASKAAIVGR